MLKKRLAVSALALSLVLMTPGFSSAMNWLGLGKKKNSIVKDVGAGALSLGALAGAAYGLYWANDYNVKKTAKPFIKLAAIGSALTAFYLCFGKFVLGNIVKSTKNSFNDFIKEKEERFKGKMDFWVERMSPRNALTSSDKIRRELQNNKHVDSYNTFNGAPRFMTESITEQNGNKRYSDLSESVVVVGYDGEI